MLRPILAVTALSLVAFAVGCGGTPRRDAFVPPSPFPARDAVARMGAQPAKPPPSRKVAASPGFVVELDEPAPSTLETELGKSLLPGRSPSMAKPNRCYARNLARFYLGASALPEERLDRFLRGACGLATPTATSWIGFVEAPRGAPDAEVVAALSKLTPPSWKDHDATVSVERDDKRVVVAIAGVRPQAEISVAGPDASGAVAVRGRLRGAPAQAVAWINQGESSAAECAVDPTVQLPAFAFSCPMAKGDASAWVQVVSRADKRILAELAAQVLVRRDPARAVEVPPSARRAGAEPDLGKAIVAGVNDARASAKLGPLALAPEQSATNGRLTPHFFSAVEASGTQADEIALGMLAGWDVAGTIRTGELLSAMITGAKSAPEWLDFSLEMPMGRTALLAPDLEQIAVGVAPPDSFGGVGAVVTTYGFFRGADHDKDAVRVLAAANRARSAHGLPAAPRIEPLPVLAREAKAVAQSSKDPMAALQDALSGESARTGRSVKGWAFATHSLDRLTWPSEVLAIKTLHLGVAVTHFKTEEMPWGVYIVYLLVPADQLP